MPRRESDIQVHDIVPDDDTLVSGAPSDEGMLAKAIADFAEHAHWWILQAPRCLPACGAETASEAQD